ncbi:MAG: hypothetical protein ACWGQW_05860 [bacterium]
MNRPTYETDLDREIEGDIAERFARHFNCTQHELPQYSRVDRVIFGPSGNLRGFIEIKRRYYECGRYNTFFVSKKKFQVMSWLYRATQLPVMLVVQFDDLIAWIDIGKVGPAQLRCGGRSDRQDPQDTEPMAHIPIDIFQFITE